MKRTASGMAVVAPLPPILTAHRRFGFVPHMLLGRTMLLAAAIFLLSTMAAQAVTGSQQPSILATLWKWTPLLAKGYAVNIGISIAAMAIGTALGVVVGVGLVSPFRPLRFGSWAITQFLRNSPWLVLLFYCMLLMPFDIKLGLFTIPLPDWFKAILALALAVMSNMAEIVRGAIQSVPTGQWEAAEALAFSRRRTMWRIILPQCIKRMLPPWMNLYALLLVSTPLCSIVGVTEILTLTADALVAEARQELLVPMYSYVLLWFFVVCYPVSKVTALLERRFSVS